VSGPALLSATEVETYMAAVDWLLELLDRDEVELAWARPSALARYSTGGVAAHAVYGGVLRLVQYLGEPEPAADHPVTMADYYGPNRVNDPDADDPLFVLLRDGAEKTARRGRAALVATGRAAREELAEILPGTPRDRAIPVVRVPGGTSPLADYLRTRVLEVVVHGDDVACSVEGLVITDPPAAAVGVCLSLCLDLARAQSGDLGALRAFTRAERADPGALRVL
jgi:hypothetical protein